uniref:Ubiquitin-like protease family profile domain-containing protein n=1 Tax=Glossina pallidipes TaxID=7398 RepID=A0A1A9ZQU7_GLOPL
MGKVTWLTTTERDVSAAVRRGRGIHPWLITILSQHRHNGQPAFTIQQEKKQQGKMIRHFMTYARVELYTDDFQRLAPERWPNDRVIEPYAKWLLQERTAASIREQELLRRQARRDKALKKKCVIIPICAQSHWRLAIVAHPDIATPTRAIYILDPIGGYSTEQIATNIRRYAEFLNMLKYQHDVNMDHHDTAEDAVLINEEPIIALTMIVVEKPMVTTNEIDDIKPTVGLLGGEVPPPRVEFGNNAEWAQLEEGDPLYQYLRAKYIGGAGTMTL